MRFHGTYFYHRLFTQVWLAVSDDPAARVTGKYFYHMRVRKPHAAAHDTELQSATRYMQTSLRSGPSGKLKEGEQLLYEPRPPASPRVRISFRAITY
jgi:hypothetical protein